MKIKMLIDMSGLYNGQPIPKKDEIWETDKNNAVDLIEKVGQNQSNLLLKRKLINQLGREVLMPYHYGKKMKSKRKKDLRRENDWLFSWEWNSTLI